VEHALADRQRGGLGGRDVFQGDRRRAAAVDRQLRLAALRRAVAPGGPPSPLLYRPVRNLARARRTDGRPWPTFSRNRG
jgi:hypothetical protein